MTNVGQSNAVGAWHDAVYLIDSNAAPIELGRQYRTTGVGKGLQYTVSMNVSLPAQLADGDYTLRFVSDAINDKLFESDETNNSIDTTATLSITHPDLVPVIETTPLTVNSGQLVDVTWHVDNRNDTDTLVVPWTDEIYISDLSGNIIESLGQFTFDGPLNGQMSTDSVTVPIRIPQTLNGDYLLFVDSDVSNSVYEADGEAGNLASVAVTVGLTPPSDLQLDSFVARPNPVVGDVAEITVSYSVTNIASGTSFIADWEDAVVASRNATLGDSDDIVLGKLPRSGVLPAFASYTVESVLKVPPGLTGAFHLFVVADYDNKLFEKWGNRE